MFRARATLRRSAASMAGPTAPMPQRPSQEGGSHVKPSRAAPFFSTERITVDAQTAAKPSFRWTQIVPAVAAHLCLGAPYAWSVFNSPLTREHGVILAATSDWSLGAIVPVVSCVFAVQGLSAALLGKYMEPLSARVNGLLSAATFGGGFMLGGLGVYIHNLPLLYLGYGVLGGLGIGLGYVPAVKNLMGWFPDRTGFASGITICGFGGAAVLAAPAGDAMMKRFARPPEYLGPVDALSVSTHEGARYATHPVTGENVNVVVANAHDMAHSLFPNLPEGVYAVGTGSTGIAETLATFGAVYFIVMATSALSYRSAPANFAPAGWKRPVQAAGAVQTYVPIDNVMKTPQFWMAFTMLGCLATAGLATASVAKTLMLDIFRPGLPMLVTAGFASGYVMSLSMANLGGRLVWSSVSDIIGRRRMFTYMTFGSIPLYLAMPYLTQHNDSVLAMSAFYGSSLLAFSFFGAAYSMLPALEADLFGKKAITATHGRMLLASSTAAIAGPSLIVALRSSAEVSAIRNLAQLCNPEDFFNRFGAPLSSLDQLIETKLVTISKLMAIVPPGTVDPSSFLYNDTLYFSAGLSASTHSLFVLFFSFLLLSCSVLVAGIATRMLRPVDPKFLVIDHGTSSDTKLPLSSLARVFIVCVDASPASVSAYAWALSQATPGLDMMIPLAIVDRQITEVPRLLHKYVMAAKEKGIFVTPLFSPSNNVGSALAAVVRAKNPYCVVLGKGERSQLAEFIVGAVKQVPVVAFVQADEKLTLKDYEEVAVRTDVTWEQLIATDGSIYEAHSKHNVQK